MTKKGLKWQGLHQTSSMATNGDFLMFSTSTDVDSLLLTPSI